MRVQLLHVRLWHTNNYAEQVMNSSSLKSSEHALFILFHVQPLNLVRQSDFFCVYVCPFTPCIYHCTSPAFFPSV